MKRNHGTHLLESRFGGGPVTPSVRRLSMMSDYPYNLPIWRRSHRAVSPDGRHIAQIDPAFEVSMGNPTSGMLCISGGPHIERCSPSFLWSDDSHYLAVSQFFERFGMLRRQRILVVAVHDQRVFASKEMAAYFQPESFTARRLLANVDPVRSRREIRFDVPRDFATRFIRIHVPWPEAPPELPGTEARDRVVT